MYYTFHLSPHVDEMEVVDEVNGGPPTLAEDVKRVDDGLLAGLLAGLLEGLDKGEEAKRRRKKCVCVCVVVCKSYKTVQKRDERGPHLWW